MSNIIEAHFNGGTRTKTRPAWLQDHGMVLKFCGIELPAAYEVHFSNARNVTAKIMIGDENGVEIPDELFLSDAPQIYAWMYMHTGEDDGWTAYEAIIPLLDRPDTTEEPPTPAEASAIQQAIAALDVAVARTEASAAQADADRQAIEDMGVTAHSLDAHVEATVNKSVDPQGAVTLDFGIPRGADAALVQAEGMYGFQVDERGHLILSYTGDEPPNYSINADGHLILTV